MSTRTFFQWLKSLQIFDEHSRNQKNKSKNDEISIPSRLGDRIQDSITEGKERNRARLDRERLQQLDFEESARIRERKRIENILNQLPTNVSKTVMEQGAPVDVEIMLVDDEESFEKAEFYVPRGQEPNTKIPGSSSLKGGAKLVFEILEQEGLKPFLKLVKPVYRPSKRPTEKWQVAIVLHVSENKVSL